MTTELAPPRGHGVVRVAHNLRHHVTHAHDWATTAGTDYWIACGIGGQTGAAGANLETLATHGWTATSIVEDVGTDGSFLSSADNDPASFQFTAASDLLTSPTLFGSYSHGLLAGQFLGYMPTSLNLEIHAQFIDATGTETSSGFGFVEGGGSIVTANDALAVIYSDGINYRLRSGAATSGKGAVDDTAWHLWRIKINASGCWFYMDGTLQNTTLLALETDEFPVNFGIGVKSGGTNYLKMAFAHIWYE